MPGKKFLVVVGGPTASGKTGFAIRLAQHFRTHILSCDSRQFFREMTIGTAVPTPVELAAAPHHFIGHRSIEEPYDVGAYEKEALELLQGLFQEKDVVILTGGSGLYLKALCEGLDSFPEVPLSVRRDVESLYQQQGLQALQSAVAAADPEFFAQVDRQNPHRLIRALAVCRASGRPFSSFRRNQPVERFFTPVYLQLYWPRSILYDRINERTDQMLQAGLLEETRRLVSYRGHAALQTVGYQELFGFLDGRHDWETAVELIKRNTRRYAKRQLTWMRRDGFWKHFHPAEWEEALDYLEIAMQQDWRWLEYPKPWPNTLISHFPFETNFGGDARILTLYQEQDLLAALLMCTLKRFELLAQPHFSPELPPRALWHFLHEAVARAEESAIYTLLPSRCRSWLAERGFQNVGTEMLTEMNEILPLRSDNSAEWFWRGEIR